MSTVLLAIGDAALRDACVQHLRRAGHAPVLVDRGLAVLSLQDRLRWDVAVVDGAALGMEALAALRVSDGGVPVVGLALEDDAVDTAMALPIQGAELIASIGRLLAEHSRPTEGVSGL